ncbi:ATP-binding cassette subfamily B protein [Roseiarcus fermentans]|uniref:ATP-binding cassette subfamily B protein n=1 Tax=Roseiarcus fermentans TaxID=1473586 RepID=A0A366EY63_9HYPH|nr:ABC transporter ATP-binding protein [Roseiarcus fermentans]RBP07333.1 ATP-binding cassette subfamily B protein [Roseiarcus fermentans]
MTTAAGNSPKGPKAPSLWRLCRLFFAHLSKRRRWQLAGVLVLTFAGVFAELATLGAVLPFLALLSNPASALHYPAIAGAAALLGWKDPADLLLPATLLFIAVALSSGGVRTLLTWSSLKFSYGVGADMGRDIYRHLLYRPFAYHATHNTSDAIAGINHVGVLISSFLNPLIQTVVSILFSITILIALLRIDPAMALSAGLGFGLIYVFATVAARQRLAANAVINAKADGARILAVQEGLGGIRDVILDSVQELYVRRFWRFDAMQKNAQSNNQFLAGLPRFLVESVGVVLIAVVAYAATRRAATMTAAIPALGALALGAQRVMPHLQQIYFGWAGLAGNRDVVADLLGKLGRPAPASAPAKAAPLRFDRSLSLRDVSFHYAADGPDVIRHVSLDIPPGARIGFVGKTGSGKSTLFDLVMGLLSPTEGAIEIDGERLTDANRQAWQAGIAHVPQFIFLSDTSLTENIAFGRERAEIDMGRVRAAAGKAQLADFIETLPKGYETVVGERGVRLSGGQRQRLGIARAFYKDARLIILDEATSALDDATENAVMAAVNAVGDGVTVLVIAHRTTTLRSCDVVFELAQGTVRRFGNYQELFCF